MLQNLFTFITGGFFYVLLELIWRGRSHVSMFFTGGFCCMVLCALFSRYSLGWPARLLLSGLLITSAEFLCGYVVNLRLGLGVWDYSKRPHNLYGQICLGYSLLWCAMALPISALGAYVAHMANQASHF